MSFSQADDATEHAQRLDGLLIGLKSVVPNGELADACRDEKLLSVLAGDNVMRLVPPLIVTAAEVVEAIARLDRACVAIERAQQGAGALKQGAAG